MRGLILAAAAAMLSSGANAGTSWTCSNADTAEVVCSSAGCDVREAGAFVSMTVAIDGYDIFDICTEDGCWSGPGTRQTVGRFEIATGVALPWDRPGAVGPNDAVLTFDRESGLGTITAPPYFGPMHCMVHPGE